MITKKKHEIDDIYTINIQKKIVFTKQTYYEGGAKATKLLAYKLKKQQAENSIYKIRNPQTKVIEHKLKEIQSCLESFYL